MPDNEQNENQCSEKLRKDEPLRLTLERGFRKAVSKFAETIHKPSHQFSKQFLIHEMYLTYEFVSKLLYKSYRTHFELLAQKI